MTAKTSEHKRALPLRAGPQVEPAGVPDTRNLPEDVSDLDETVLQVYDRLVPQLGRNTLTAVRSDALYLDTWHRAVYGEPLRIPLWASHAHLGEEEALAIAVERVESFIHHHLNPDGMPETVDTIMVDRAGRKRRKGPASPQTVDRRLSSLRLLHENAGRIGYPSPTAARRVRETLKRYRKMSRKHGNQPRRKSKATATTDMITRMMDACGDDLRGRRDRAVIAFAFDSGGRRRSELGYIRIQDVQAETIDAGSSTETACYLVTLPVTKTTGVDDPPQVLVASPAAVEALTKWLREPGLADDGDHPLFPAIRRRAGYDKDLRLRETTGDSPGISGDTVNRIVKERAHEAAQAARGRAYGLRQHDQADERETEERAAESLEQLSAHGLRSGFITETLKSGATLRDVMELSLHRNVRTVMTYWQGEDLKKNRARGVLG